MLGKIHSHLVSQEPTLLRLSLKVTPFALPHQVLEQLLGWQFHGVLAEGELAFLESRREDPDTLFFQHRLRIEGNTELGLHVKNLVDAIRLGSMPSILRLGLLCLAEFIKAGQKEGVDQHDRALSSC
ncbi:putative sterol carrier protein, SCP [Xenorhabdus bovienii str. Jollieti]|uniref:Putative sterol carrier protein, SCP n=1 Tax=Xenorhabdus bovienii (strain SS-2004) TaxID=406818 RepID=D3UZ09_XENBS|nr:SCP2 sterol-binding domain-containing protein [Xenorhabdus bovienii]CBJ79537.1 putative sterol carrier protein, SCP [Xenorhabdus bovienii SS-2004]CDH27405.1 putative sterol carrier protein, SCP [Xenorhabdus bovienii str. Jollieti]